MSKKIKCKNHDLILSIPQEDIEHISLIAQVTQLLEHLKQFPSCIFEEIQQKI